MNNITGTTKNRKFTNRIIGYDSRFIPLGLDVLNMILITKIKDLNNTNKGCFASNEYFAGLIGIHSVNTSVRIQDLEKLGFIKTKIKYVNSKRERRIFYLVDEIKLTLMNNDINVVEITESNRKLINETLINFKKERKVKQRNIKQLEKGVETTKTPQTPLVEDIIIEKEKNQINETLKQLIEGPVLEPTPEVNIGTGKTGENTGFEKIEKDTGVDDDRILDLYTGATDEHIPIDIFNNNKEEHKTNEKMDTNEMDLDQQLTRLKYYQKKKLEEILNIGFWKPAQIDQMKLYTAEEMYRYIREDLGYQSLKMEMEVIEPKIFELSELEDEIEEIERQINNNKPNK